MACGSVGPGTIRSAEFDYKRAITGSWDQQLLLNLVRLRYRDTPQFMQVGSVLAGTPCGAAVLRGWRSTSTAPRAPHDRRRGGLSGTADHHLRAVAGQTVHQAPPDPDRLEPLFLLAGSGWSIERLLRCCVQQINGIRNAPTTAGPTPRFGNAATRFSQLAFMLRSMQLDGTLAGVIDVKDPDMSRSAAPRFVLRQTPDIATNQRISELRQMLGLLDQWGAGA